MVLLGVVGETEAGLVERICDAALCPASGPAIDELVFLGSILPCKRRFREDGIEEAIACIDERDRAYYVPHYGLAGHDRKRTFEMRTPEGDDLVFTWSPPTQDGKLHTNPLAAEHRLLVERFPRSTAAFIPQAGAPRLAGYFIEGGHAVSKNGTTPLPCFYERGFTVGMQALFTVGRIEGRHIAHAGYVVPKIALFDTASARIWYPPVRNLLSS